MSGRGVTFLVDEAIDGQREEFMKALPATTACSPPTVGAGAASMRAFFVGRASGVVSRVRFGGCTRASLGGNCS